MSSELRGLATLAASDSVAARALLREAKAEFRNGSFARSWQACQDAASIGRALNDATIVADAAIVITGASVGGGMFGSERHRLCLEALSLLGDTDPARTAQLEAQLIVTHNPWVQDDVPSRAPLSLTDVERRAIELHARHTAAIGVGHVMERLACAGEMATLSVSPDGDEQLAWATLWRLDAFCQLGLRVELNTELINLTALVRRLRSPVWTWRAAAARAAIGLLDGHFEDVQRLVEQQRQLGAAGDIEEAPFLDLVLRSSLAVRTGVGLAAIEVEVRRTVRDLPFFAHGWHARILLALGRTDEAVEIWRALASRLDDLPVASHEWLVATAVHAELCVAASDKSSARRLMSSLEPFSELHVMAGVMAPYEGPVAYYLGLLAALTGQFTLAHDHLSESIRRSEVMHAPAFTELARVAISSLISTGGPLTLREREVADLVASGSTNREIATGLTLSERTVENHVSNVLRKIGINSRSGVAAWIAR